MKGFLNALSSISSSSSSFLSFSFSLSVRSYVNRNCKLHNDQLSAVRLSRRAKWLEVISFSSRGKFDVSRVSLR